MPYPTWSFFPRNVRHPDWVGPLLNAVTGLEPVISTADGQGPKSDAVLHALAPGRQELGYSVELTKTKNDKIRRPVLFGENGRPSVTYEIDAWHEGHGIAVEVEAGRGTQNNADYRDIVRTCLMLDARYLVRLMPVRYAPPSMASNPVWGYRKSFDLLDALYASQRLRLPLEGVLLVGY